MRFARAPWLVFANGDRCKSLFLIAPRVTREPSDFDPLNARERFFAFFFFWFFLLSNWIDFPVTRDLRNLLLHEKIVCISTCVCVCVFCVKKIVAWTLNQRGRRCLSIMRYEIKDPSYDLLFTT